MLRPISTSIWETTNNLVTAGIHFQIRMTVIRLEDGSLVLHSPTPINDALAAELDALGTVEHVIAPNRFHYLYLEAAAQRYPQAKVYAAPGLKKKKDSLPIHEELSREAPSAWRGQLEQVFIDGLPLANEVVFFHPKDKVLIVTDLFFNIHESDSLMTRMVMRIAGAWKKTAQSRLLRMGVKNRGAAAASVAELLRWDFQIAVMAHGRIVEQDTRTRVTGALEWMARGA